MSWRSPDTESIGPGRQTEAQRLELTEGGLKLSVERVLQNLQAAERILATEHYSCTAPVGLNSVWVTEGPTSLVWWDPLNWPFGSVRQTDQPPTVTQGPTSLLCGLPTCGAYPWVCGKHWLDLRSIRSFKDRRLRREYKRSLKK